MSNKAQTNQIDFKENVSMIQNQKINDQIPKTEVRPAKVRRIFSAEYKLNILDELDRCSVIGEQGVILRREGLYTSMITDWRNQRKTGALSALGKVRGRKFKFSPKDKQINALEEEITVLKRRLAQAEAVIDVQKKVSEIFGINPQGSNEKTR